MRPFHSLVPRTLAAIAGPQPRALGLAVAALILLLTGCHDRPTTAVSRTAVRQQLPTATLAASLTAAALRSLTGHGTLVTDSTANDAEISPAQARLLAVTFIQQYGRFDRSVLEAAFGGPIDFARLEAHERVFYAHSPYGAIDSRYSRPMAKAYGSYYLVTLTQDEVPAVSIAVSAHANDLTVRNGRIVAPIPYGNEFLWIGIRNGFEVPITPERAVRLATDATGLPAATTPVLVAPTPLASGPNTRGGVSFSKGQSR